MFYWSITSKLKISTKRVSEVKTENFLVKIYQDDNDEVSLKGHVDGIHGSTPPKTD